MFQVAISPKKECYLFDHKIKDVVVLPIVEVIDWFYQIIERKRGIPFMYQLNEFEVLSSIKLGNFMKDTSITIQHQPANLTLFFNEKLSYRAKYELINPNTQKLMPSQKAQYNWPWSAEEIYEKKILFHGKSFQVIHQLIGTDSEGCTGIISSKQWKDSPQIIDRLVLDGGLQLACVWMRSLLNKASLPMRIASIKYYQPIKQASFITCLLKGKLKNSLRGVIDLQFFEENQLIFELSGLEMLVYEE